MGSVAEVDLVWGVEGSGRLVEVRVGVPGGVPASAADTVRYQSQFSRRAVI